MNILVTGGAGRVGRYVVQELLAHGHTVTSVDIAPQPTADFAALQIDLTQAGEVYNGLARSQAEAVVHLGAWPNAGMTADTRTYADNVSGTYNVFQACADLGIRRVISASSNQIYGFAGTPPAYAPVDESHPLRPVNCYALSKIAGEQAAVYFTANYGMTILSFRLMGVRMPEQIPAEIEQMAADPASGAWLLWTRTDARDAALACRLALEAANPPSGPYNITGAEVVINRNTASLIEEFFGGKTAMRGTLPGRTSPLSCAAAEKAFGYRPRYVWGEGNYHLE
ncbi:MAG: NAD(P)-dependent oxidoreductase [Caldilineaceae bacterium]|nr:NAD(P)-dependent oxidoreductase [Caldilineaceae bacterium]